MENPVLYDNSLSRPGISKSFSPTPPETVPGAFSGGVGGGALPKVNGALPWGNTLEGWIGAPTAGVAAQPIATTPVALPGVPTQATLGTPFASQDGRPNNTKPRPVVAVRGATTGRGFVLDVP
jgi:hypothetical protein